MSIKQARFDEKYNKDSLTLALLDTKAFFVQNLVLTTDLHSINLISSFIHKTP